MSKSLNVAINKCIKLCFVHLYLKNMTSDHILVATILIIFLRIN